MSSMILIKLETYSMTSLALFGLGVCVGVIVFALIQPDYDKELVRNYDELQHRLNKVRLENEWLKKHAIQNLHTNDPTSRS